MPHIKSLYRYPIKSLGRQVLSSVQLTDYGLEYDRHWMIVDKDHSFVTQRELPQLTNFSAAVIDQSLTISNNTSKESISISVTELTTETVKTDVWGAAVTASQVSHQVNEWLSDQLKTQLILVGAGEAFSRHKERGQVQIPLKFADGYPILVLSQASVDHLNEKLETPIDESRFRANVIIDDCAPHSEDIAKTMSAPQATLELIKPCRRCIMVNTNQVTGEVLKEPLKTLASYRAQDNHIMFGVNARAAHLGLIHVNDEIEIGL